MVLQSLRREMVIRVGRVKTPMVLKCSARVLREIPVVHCRMLCTAIGYLRRRIIVEISPVDAGVAFVYPAGISFPVGLVNEGIRGGERDGQL